MYAVVFQDKYADPGDGRTRENGNLELKNFWYIKYFHSVQKIKKNKPMPFIYS